MVSALEDDAFADNAFPAAVADRVEHGARFVGLFATSAPGGTRILAVLARGHAIEQEALLLPAGRTRYPGLAQRVPAAEWYERAILDLHGLEPTGRSRPDPLVFPLRSGAGWPRPTAGGPPRPTDPDPPSPPPSLQGEGVFTIPYGPVRSGVFEAVEYLVETPGEDIPHLRTRVFYKHRGIEKRFEDMSIDDGVLLAERYEGVASVAHAMAFCGAVERVAGVEIPPAAGAVRVVHAELERIANHLDSTVRHVEGAGQAVAFARFSLHKERVMRLRGQLSGSRFGRGVIVPGGVSGAPGLGGAELLQAVDRLEKAIRADCRLLLATPSFVDRLRGTGVVSPELAARYTLVGPVGRASGQHEDVRVSRPYAAYGHLGQPLAEPRSDGDALTRLHVRFDEMWGSFHLLRQAADDLDRTEADRTEADRTEADRTEADRTGRGTGSPWRNAVGPVSGEALGWAEAPQGEVAYLVELHEGSLVHARVRSASFHNLAAFALAFPHDILTDFAFIEASFGLSIAGASG